MSGTKASDVAARLSRSLTSPPAAAPPTEAPQPTPIRSGVVRTTERFTVDLTPDLNDALAQWATRLKRTVGRRVPKTEVVRLLVELGLEDPTLATQVEERLKGQG